MATSAEHYERLLGGVYSWMVGGFDAALKQNAEHFRRLRLAPQSSGVAVDLGAGCGFQSMPLADLGYSVTAIDLDEQLLNELKAHAGARDIECVRDDLSDFSHHVGADVELVVCMTDTLLHLESKARVQRLFRDISEALEPDGRFLATFRDLTHELKDLDRFIPVRSDENTILTCFLEYEPESVKVHDILQTRHGGEWKLETSFYRKLRLSEAWVVHELEKVGFSMIDSALERGMISLTARRS